MPELDKEKAREAFEKCLETGKTIFICNEHLAYSENCHPTLIQGYVEDIRERHIIESATRSLVENLSDIMSAIGTK